MAPSVFVIFIWNGSYFLIGLGQVKMGMRYGTKVEEDCILKIKRFIKKNKIDLHFLRIRKTLDNPFYIL